MRTLKQPSDGSSLHGFNRRKLRPTIELIESRILMASGLGFIAGTAFIDQAKTGLLDFTDPYLSGATIQLYKSGQTTPIASTKTDANGAYIFNNLAPGTYVVTETPPTNYQATHAQVLSTIEKGTAIAANSIQVVVPGNDPLYLNYTGVEDSEFQTVVTKVNGQTENDAVGPLHASLGTAAGKTDIARDWLTYCVDDLSRLTFGGGEQFQVVPEAITNLSNGTSTISAEHAGRIAFLYNHFGTTTLSNIQGPALQLAIWELLYDSSDTANFSSGNFSVQGPLAPTTQTTLNQVLAQAQAYYNQSAGRSETGLLLHATGTGGTGYQSMLGTGSFNFGNQTVGDQNLQHSAISGFTYCDVNRDNQFDNGDMPIAAVTMTLTGTDQTGAAVKLTTTTDSTGAYHFLNLVPGMYTITETLPSGYLPGAVTQGTPGTGTVVSSLRDIANITLAGGVNGQNNDFGQIDQPISVESINLYGIHHQQSQIVLKLTGPVDPGSASNPASYTLIALGKDETLGTKDDQRVAILSAAYNPLSNEITLTPATHLNLHYHYLLQSSVGPVNACAPSLSNVSIFGRSSMVVWDWHGTMIAPPSMTQKEVHHNARVVGDAQSYLRAHPSTVFSIHKTAAQNKMIQGPRSTPPGPIIDSLRSFSRPRRMCGKRTNPGFMASPNRRSRLPGDAMKPSGVKSLDTGQGPYQSHTTINPCERLSREGCSRIAADPQSGSSGCDRLWPRLRKSSISRSVPVSSPGRHS